MAKNIKSVTIDGDSYLAALKVAAQFNLASRKSQPEKAADVLIRAIGLVESLSDKMADGWTLDRASAWTYLDDIFNIAIGQEMAAQKGEISTILGLNQAVDLPEDAAAKLQKIKKVLGLKSDEAASRMAIRLYSYICSQTKNGDEGFSLHRGDVLWQKVDVSSHVPGMKPKP